MTLKSDKLMIDHRSAFLPTTYNSSPNRSTISSADAVDVTALASTVINVVGKSTLVVSVEFSASGANCIVVPVFYDSDGTVMFIGADMNFTATTLRRGAAGDYMAAVGVQDTQGATTIRLLLKYISSGNVDIFGGVI